ncbi:flagellar biosynthesis protein FlhF [Halobacillus fulvus]|nr:flagellar biosynthesis protein FlhF [Halobacillus fulvus]
MKVKKYLADNMPEAMKKVKKELGDDAVILNSKKVKVGGFLGMFKKEQTEVVAAVDPVGTRMERKSSPPVPQPVRSSEPLKDEDGIWKELRELKSMIQKQEKLPGELQEAYDQLIEQGFQPELAKELTTEAEDPSAVIDQLSERLSSLSFGSPAFEKRYVHLVGPTGVGKTTTLAKLAANAVLNEQKKVAFITTDTYRIAAIEQLKTYAELLNVPVEVAYSPEDYQEAREKFASYDLVFIDTAGRNFRDPAYVEEMNQLIDFREDSETYLVLALTSKYTDMETIYGHFRSIPIRQLIFTKMDETSSYGCAINLALKHEIGIAFLTNGQNVPDDLIAATPQLLTAHVAEGVRYERSG